MAVHSFYTQTRGCIHFYLLDAHAAEFRSHTNLLLSKREILNILKASFFFFFQRCVSSTNVRDKTLHQRLEHHALKHANRQLYYSSVTQELNC